MTLAEYIIEKMHQPFQYGVNDCVIFSVGWAEISNKKKYLPAKIWKNEKEALKIIKKNNGIESALDKHFKRIEPNYASDGDISVVDGIAYLFSGTSLVSVGKDGIKNISRLKANIAWAIYHG